MIDRYLDHARALPWWAYLVVGLVVILCWRRRSDAGTSGRVIGIVGRMGSGKSYGAVRLAFGRMRRGANVATNFTMRLEPRHPHPCKKRCVRKGWCVCRRRWRLVPRRLWHGFCPCQLAPRWRYFRGWEQLATLENCVVIVDEAHFLAPSIDPRAIPKIAQWKMAMARKYCLDIYWLSQHEDRVSRQLRDLTGLIYLCNCWLGGLFFTMKAWEPEKMRRRHKHADRKAYRFKLRLATLYDTLEVLTLDELVKGQRGDTTMRQANELAEDYNRRRGLVTDETTAAPAPSAEVVDDPAAAEVATLLEHLAPPPPPPTRPAPKRPQRPPGARHHCAGTYSTGSPCRRLVEAPGGLCGPHERAAQVAALATPNGKARKR